MDKIKAIGRRKSSVARIDLVAGKGKIEVNSRDLAIYFPTEVLQTIVKQPLAKIEEEANYDINVNVAGGGLTGQAEAARLAIARALVQINPENKPSLKSEGFMTRDPRMVERKKAGRRKARRSFQFSKR